MTDEVSDDEIDLHLLTYLNPDDGSLSDVSPQRVSARLLALMSNRFIVAKAPPPVMMETGVLQGRAYGRTTPGDQYLQELQTRLGEL